MLHIGVINEEGVRKFKSFEAEEVEVAVVNA